MDLNNVMANACHMLANQKLGRFGLGCCIGSTMRVPKVAFHMELTTLVQHMAYFFQRLITLCQTKHGPMVLPWSSIIISHTHIKQWISLLRHYKALATKLPQICVDGKV